MVGEQRSGSNLLRLILNQSKELVAPHPPHILQRLMPLMPLYGDLEEDNAFSRLVDDVCRLIETNPVPWAGVELDRQDVSARCRRRSLVAVYGAVMEICAEAHGARGSVCKSMQNIRWAQELDDYFPEPKYIYLYRDPRDVALSFTKAVIGEKHPYFIAQQWAELQRLCLKERERIGSDRFFSLRYEALIDRPRDLVDALCEFLNIEFHEEMLCFHQSREASRTAVASQLWQNLDRPIMGSNSRKFLTEMSEEDIRVVESLAGDVMDQLGYERIYVNSGMENRYSAEMIDRFKAVNENRKREIAARTDAEDLERRRLQTQVLEEIRSYAPSP
jgi:hypothetical protein